MDRRLLMLALGMFALGTDSFVMAGVLPEIARTFNVGIGAAGQMTTVYAIAYALLSPTIAALAASVPRKRMLLSGLGVFIAANLATAVAPTFGFALVTRAIAGLGAAMFSPTATGAATMIVPPDRRGFALSVVIAGLTAATALGSPIGTMIGGLGDWRWTMVFVAALGAVSGLGIWIFLADVPLPAKVTLRQRIAPLADARVGLTLLSTLLAMAGLFTVYTYFSVVFDRTVGGSTFVLGGLLVLWGAAGTFSNLMAGRFIDSVGSRKVLLVMLTILVIDLALLPWSSANGIVGAAIAIAVWGACGWGLLVPQQHRLVTIAPSVAPIVLGLNTASTYLGVSAAGLIGAGGIHLFGAHYLGLVGAVLVAVALVVSELASRRIAMHRSSALAAA
jgi:DHA1 family inner membrane transport protein